MTSRTLFRTTSALLSGCAPGSYPGTAYIDHLSSAMGLLAAGICLVLKPVPAQALNTAMPEEHKGQLRYALRSGVLPLDSLFCDWRGELAQQERAYSLALRVLPTGTAVVVLIDGCGIPRDPAGGPFFLVSAIVTATFGLAAFGFSVVRLANACVVEGKLREQICLLNSYL